MRVGYARLSTGDPEGLTLAIQTDRLTAAGCQRIYSEVISGNARRRPEWEALKQAIAAGLVTEVVSVRMDRLSRSWTAIGEVIQLFAAPGAPKLTLLDEPEMDLSTIGGRTVAGVLSSVAAGERERIVARAKGGLGAFFASGRRVRVPFGLTTDSDHRPTPDRRPFLCTLADRREWNRAEVALHLWSCWETAPSRYAAKREAALLFGLQSFGGGSAAVWACNPGLRGARTGGKRDRYGGYPAVEEGAFEALIEPERHLAAVAQFLRERATNATRHEGRVSPLSGKAICRACGRKMQFHRLPSRPGTAWTFRCRREGCELHGRRIRYDLIFEACRQHLLTDLPRLQSALLTLLSPPAVDPDLAQQLAVAMRRVESRRALVAEDPGDPDLQRSLERAESQLADLQLAQSGRQAPPVQPGPFLQAVAALLGGVEVDGDAVVVRMPAGGPPAAAAVERLLSPDGWKANAGLLLPALIRECRVDAVAGTIEVVGTTAPVLPAVDGRLVVPLRG